MNILRKILPISTDPTKRIFNFFAISTFFYAVANGISSYYFPILALETGLSYAEMGILYSSSSVFGIVFDLLLSKYLKNTNYKRLMLYSIVLMIVFPILIVTSSAIAVYIVAVAIWALYTNLSTFGGYDFTAVEAKKEDHAKTFAYLSIFNDLGYVVAPLIAGYAIIKLGDLKSLTMPVFAGVIALVFMLAAISLSNKKHATSHLHNHPARSIKSELFVLLRIGLRLWPLLLLYFNLTLMESAFWTVAPIIENLFAGLKGMGGLILALSMIPTLLISWSVAPLTKLYGKKHTAFYTFCASNLLLLTIGYLSNVYLILLVVFLVNLLQAITYPAAAATLADYLKESASYDNEIIATNDLAANLGYIIGPSFAGIAMSLIGDLRIFSVIALLGIVSSLILIIFSPKNIPFYDRNLRQE